MARIQHVLITGATRFIGAHVVNELLRRGLRVRAAPRSKAKAAEMFLTRPQYTDKLNFIFVGDLTEPGGFDKTAESVDAVIHTASPVFYDIKDNERELILPAIKGTENVLSAAKKSSSVKRFLFTSSFVAIVDIPRGAEPGLVYTPGHWNPVEYAEGVAGDAITAYRVGKKYAERAVWDAVNTEDAYYDVVIPCPPMVFGSVVHPVSRVEDLDDLNSYLWNVASGGQSVTVACVLLGQESAVPCPGSRELLLYTRGRDHPWIVQLGEGSTEGTANEGVPEWPKGDAVGLFRER